jgi:tungstate transport system substrate-binding protein
MVAQGTGEALLPRGEVTPMGCSYARAAEQKFIAEGFGVQRLPAMYNDIILHRTGARSNQHQGNGRKCCGVAALEAIAEKRTPFVSRGDRSGTHQAELAL